MFDNVGRDLDAERGRRRIAALLATLGLSAGVGLLALGFVAWRAAHLVIDILPDDGAMPPLVEILTEGDEVDLGSLPPPPALLGVAAQAVPAHEPVEPTDPAPLVPELPATVTTATPAGTPDGSAAGTADGEGDAPGPGAPGGDGTGFGGNGDGHGGVRTVHHSEVTVKRPVTPIYPHAAEGLGLGDVSCLAEVSIDESGVPYDVSVEGCPTMFVESAQQALFKWRWYPAKADGRAVRAKFLMRVNYIDHEEN